jgi:hypothetical protein
MYDRMGGLNIQMPLTRPHSLGNCIFYYYFKEQKKKTSTPYLAVVINTCT